MSNKKNHTPTDSATIRLYRNLRLTSLLILVPFLIGIFALYYTFSGFLGAQLAMFGSNRLITDGWQTAHSQLTSSQPDYGPKIAYYRLKVGQDLEWVARHFSVNPAKLRELNPGEVAYGTTIAVPPVQSPLITTPTSTNFGTLVVRNVDGVLQVSNDFRNPLVIINIPQLNKLLTPYGTISKQAEKTYRINKPLSIENNIRLDITNETVNKLELSSSPDFGNVCMCFENAEVLIKNVAITSVNPLTNQPDLDQEDGRSFIRALNSTRMDIINSDVSYLGTSLTSLQNQQPIYRNGGIYGTSWRINDEKLGKDIATGWVQDSRFHNNYFGAFSFGASGMMWRGNQFNNNEVYGLDPHDDSNNATIEKNRFINNGKHGFIVSKRCNNNIIRDNLSADNELHGYMLHQDSNYNLIENNIAIGNTDNFVIYSSAFNTIKGNKSYDPSSSHVRLNAQAKHSYIQGNTFYGGWLGIYLYEEPDNLLIEGNTFSKMEGDILKTDQAKHVLWVNNKVDSLRYKISQSDRVVFGPNRIQTQPVIDLSPLN